MWNGTHLFYSDEAGGEAFELEVYFVAGFLGII
jgi:hypothetical protein